MIARRALVTGAVTGMAALLCRDPAAAQSADRAVRLGYVWTGALDQAGRPSQFAVFDATLSELARRSRPTFTVDYHFAGGPLDQLPPLVAKLVQSELDAIFVQSRPAVPIVKRATTSLPVVFVSLGDPVAEGWVASIARPGANLTGIAGLSPEASGKRLELLRDLIPRLARVDLLWNPANLGEALAVDQSRAAATHLGIELVVHAIDRTDQISPVLRAAARDGAGAVVVLPDPVLFASRDLVVQTLLDLRLPAIHVESGWARAGGLITFAPNFDDMFRRAAAYVDRVLRGARPSDLPVDQPTSFELTINLRTARALGLTVPQQLLLRADEVIE